MLAAVLFWLALRVFSLPATAVHLRRYGYIYGLAGFGVLLLVNILCGLILIVIGIVFALMRLTARRSDTSASRP